jgi:hypothetical protein
MGKDFIPAADLIFDVWGDNLVDKLEAGATTWKIPPAAIDLLKTERSRWKKSLAEAENPATRTKGAIQEKQTVKTEYKAEIRKILKIYVTYNPLITDRDREEMNLPIHKTTITPAPIAGTMPWLRPRTDLLRHITFDFGGSETSKAKPPGQHGLELAWEITADTPGHINHLTHSAFHTRTPLTLEFDEDKRGKTLWYAARWENTRGEKGPWSEIRNIIIP